MSVDIKSKITARTILTPIARQNYYAESLGVSTYNATTNYQDKVVLTFTPDANSTYIIIASWILGMSPGSYYGYGKLTRSTGTAKDFNIQVFQPRDNSDLVTGGGIAIDTFGASPTSQTYKIQYATSNTSGIVSIRNATIIAIKLDAVDKTAIAEARTTTISTSWVDKTTLTFTPASQGDYLLFAIADMDGSSIAYDFKVQITIDGTGYNITNIESIDASNRYIWCILKKTTLSAASHTIKIQHSTEHGNNTCGIANARIIALRLDAFDNNYYAEVEARTTTSNTAYQDSTTLTQKPDVGFYLVFGSAGVDVTSAIYSGYVQLIEGAVSKGEMVWECKDATTRGNPYFIMYRSSYTKTSKTWKLQHKVEDAGLTCGIQNARISVLKLNPYVSDEESIFVGGATTQRVRNYLKSDLSFNGQKDSYGGNIFSIEGGDQSMSVDIKSKITARTILTPYDVIDFDINKAATVSTYQAGLIAALLELKTALAGSPYYIGKIQFEDIAVLDYTLTLKARCRTTHATLNLPVGMPFVLTIIMQSATPTILGGLELMKANLSAMAGTTPELFVFDITDFTMVVNPVS